MRTWRMATSTCGLRQASLRWSATSHKLPGANLHQENCFFCDKSSHLNWIQLSVPIVVHFTKGSAGHLQSGGVHQQSHGLQQGWHCVTPCSLMC